MNSKNKTLTIIVGSLLAGLLLGWLFFQDSGEPEAAHEHDTPGEMEDQIWTCSMHPQIRQNEPGDCPLCGMDLIPLENQNASLNPEAVTMNDYAMKLANVQTMEVGTGEAGREIKLNGKVALDERLVYTQSSHVPGRIEQLRVNFTGEEVRRGELLATVYSPELATAQEELLQAYAIRESNPELFEAAKEKLRNWRISEQQIERILEGQKAIDQFNILADVNGVVTEKMVELGDYVERGMPIYQIADLSKVWVLFDLYESNMNFIEEGDTIEFTVASLPGEEFQGKVNFVDPLLNDQTRVTTARVEVENKDGKLKPGMFVSGTLENPYQISSGQITVPKTAVLWTGKRSVVYVKEDIGTFALREVVLGPSLGDSYVIQEGLESGEEIVVNGTFNVDAAAQLAGKPSMMNPDSPVAQDEEVNTNVVDFFENSSIDFRDEISPSFRPKFNELLSNYLELKEALVQGEDQKSTNFAKDLESVLENLEAEFESEEADKFWEERRTALLAHTNDIGLESDLEEQRKIFVLLSEEMIKAVAAFGTGEGIIYVDYCPMADSDEGAYWLSAERTIRNPYFGDAMLTCGEIVNEIN